MYRLLPKQVGRRGICLLAISYQAISFGLSQIFQPPVGANTTLYRFLFHVAPPTVWGGVGVAVGVVCLIGAFAMRLRNVAYALIIFLTCVYLVGFVAAAVTGSYRGWASAGNYVAWLVICQTIAGWPEAGHSKIDRPRWRRHGTE